MNNLDEETKYIMKKYKIKANKDLGQNFLINEDVVKKIVDSANISNEDLVIEIGPGLGTLTKFLLKKAKKVICIELDKKMIKLLNDRFLTYENFELINNDVLTIDIDDLIKNERKKYNYKNIKIVANLPYYITTPIISKLIESKEKIESITVMIQKEVADRLIEKPGGKNTGAITYFINYYCYGEKILDVPKEAFIPNPKVSSEVIKLTIREKPAVEIEAKALMFKIIKCAFLQRRKTLINSLVNSKIVESKENAIKMLESLNIDINSRPEQLLLEDYVNITKYFINKFK